MTLEGSPDAVIDAIDWESWVSTYGEDVIAELANAYELAMLGAYPDLSEIVAHQRAVEWATQHAADLIQGIADTTRDNLRSIISDFLDNGSGALSELEGAIRDAYSFSSDRAALIAQTETAYAIGFGERAAARESGAQTKQWFTQGGESVCAECEGNAGDGEIGIDDSFSSGDDTIPAHPGCQCDVTYAGEQAGNIDNLGGLDEENAAAIAESGNADARGLIAEARCPTCSKLLDRDAPVGVAIWCRKCKAKRMPVGERHAKAARVTAPVVRWERRTVEERERNGRIKVVLIERGA